MSLPDLETRIAIVNYRIENAVKTLDEARHQIQNGYYNTAVNRMYYACYYAACSLLIANGIMTKSHDGVRQMLSLHFIKTGKLPSEIGRYYGRLFANRLTGDYDDFFDHTMETANGFLPLAELIVETIKSHVGRWLDEQTPEQ